MVSILEIKLIFYISQIASKISESNLSGGGVSTVFPKPILPLWFALVQRHCLSFDSLMNLNQIYTNIAIHLNINIKNLLPIRNEE